MITLIIIIFGVVSLTRMPVELYANTSFGEISIIIQARGGIPPTEVEDRVTKIVEEGVATVSNLEQLLSISKEGESTVVMSFQPGTDMDFAALEVREKFAKVKNLLPKEIEKPVIAQFQQGDVPVIIVSATSEQRSTEAIRKIVDDTMKESLKRVGGVANVEIAGGRERKILVESDQVRLAAYGISIDELTSTLGANNLNLLSGEVERVQDRILIRMIGEFETVDQIRHLALRRTPTGSVIRVKDVASVKDSFLEAGEFARLNVRPVVTAYVQKETTKNTIKVANEVLQVIEDLKAKLPKDIHLIVTSNQAVFIKKAIDNLRESLLQGISLIFLVFFIFLFKLSKRYFLTVIGLLFVAALASGWVAMALFFGLIAVVIGVRKLRPIFVVNAPIPISIVGTFIFMRAAGLTINVMTLFGIALGVGMLMDTSVCVFENILKKREGGQGIAEAAVNGSQEMFLPIIASTVANVIVFLPLVFMGAELQKLYSGMAITIVVTQIISMFAAVTLIPALSSRRAFSVQEAPSQPKEEGTSLVKRFMAIERKFLFRSIRHRWKVLGAALGIFAVTMFFASKLGMEYLGSTEQNKFTIYIEMPTGARLDVTDKTVKKVETLLKKVPEVVTMSSRVEPWSSKVYVEVKKSGERRRSVDDIIDAIRQETNKLQPAFIYFQQEEQVGTKEVVLEIYGYSYDKLRELAIAITNRLQQIRGLSDTKIRMREGRPEMQVIVNKKKAALSELTVSDTANQIHGQMRGLRATVFHSEGKEVETISRLDEKYRKTFKDLHNLIITSRGGEPVILDQISDFKFGLGPSEIWRKNKSRIIQVSANIGKVPLSKVVEKVKEGLKDVPFPEDYYYRVAGDYPTLQKSSKQMRMMIAFVLILVYLVLASLFESFNQPLLIMAAVPLAMVGAIAALYLGPKSIGIGAMLGMMMLAGIVVNNSIMLIDCINGYVKDKGISPVRAAVLANKDRIRPILMTMCSTILGLVPMAIDRSEGANLWSPLAMTVIGGVLSSTVLTLMVTPAFYIIFNDIGTFLRTRLALLSKRIAVEES
jgi:HAE1 family hydrophobic/amphiphilic exporter-1